MKDTKFYIGIIALLVLSGCYQQKSSLISTSLGTQKEVSKPQRFNKIEARKIKQANKQYKFAYEDHAEAFYVLGISEHDQDKALKKIIFGKNKAWAQKYWSTEQWFGVGINEYHSLPFITYHNSLKKQLRKLKKWKLFLEKRNYNADSLLRDITTIIPKLQDLLDLTEGHNRYLQEKDKHESMSKARQMYYTLICLK